MMAEAARQHLWQRKQMLAAVNFLSAKARALTKIDFRLRFILIMGTRPYLLEGKMNRLSDSEINQVAGAMPSKIFIGMIYGGIVSDLAVERGGGFRNWARFSSLFGQRTQSATLFKLSSAYK